MRALLQLKDNSVFFQFYLSYLVLLHMSIMLSNFRLCHHNQHFAWHFAELQGNKIPALKKLTAQGLQWEQPNSVTLASRAERCVCERLRDALNGESERFQRQHPFACLTGLRTCAGAVSLMGRRPAWLSECTGWGDTWEGAEPAAAVAAHVSWKHEPAAWWLCKMHSLPP